MPRRLWTPRPREGDGLPLTRGQFRTWKRHALWGYVGLTAVSVLAAFLGFRAGERTDAGLRRAGLEATQRSCVERVEGRIVQAQGLDDLRRAALGRKASSAEALAFLRRTQPAIDQQMSRAAGRSVRLDPEEPLTEEIVAPTRAAGRVRCERQAREQFGSADAGP